jgi:hypothetical protein
VNDQRPCRHEQIWQRLRRVILDAVYMLMGPPPRDVVQKIDDVLRDAEQDWKKGEGRCRDDDETP